MIDPEYFLSYPEISVVAPSEVHTQTINGWVVLAVIPSSRVEEGSQEFPNPKSEYSYDTLLTGTITHVVHQPLFVLGRSKENTDLASRLGKVEAQVTELEGFLRSGHIDQSKSPSQTSSRILIFVL